MLYVKFSALRMHRRRSLAYGMADWRLDVLATGRCQRCGGRPVLYGPSAAECPACGLWFDGLLFGCTAPERT